MRNILAKTPNLFAISCDWLQIHVKAKQNLMEKENALYYFKRSGQSKVFRSIYKIINSVTGNSVAYYCTDANECIMSRDEGVLKFENSQLYLHEDLKIFVEDFLKRMELKFLGITRFDIAFDFEYFYNFYYPENFIRDFIYEKIVKVNVANSKKFGFQSKQKGGIINKNEKNEKEEIDIAIHGEQSTKLIFETIYFGSKNSDIKIKLYNKTKELKANPKPHITNFHLQNFGQSDKQQIWRLEFSLSSMSMFFCNKETLINYNSLDVLDIKNMYSIFMGLFEKYFEFRIKKKRGERIARMEKKILWIFDFDFLKLHSVKLPAIIRDPTKTTKTAIKAIDQFNNDFRKFDENLEISAKDLITKIAEIHDLKQWCKDKNIPFNGDENYSRNVNEFSNILQNDIKLQQDYEKAKIAALNEKKKLDEIEARQKKKWEKYLNENKN